jgi:hypothetical protein
MRCGMERSMSQLSPVSCVCASDLSSLTRAQRLQRLNPQHIADLRRLRRAFTLCYGDCQSSVFSTLWCSVYPGSSLTAHSCSHSLLHVER